MSPGASTGLRVLMVTSSYPKRPGDVTAPFIESIARGVAARGHRVDVVLPQHPDLARGDDEPVRFHPYRYVPRDEWALFGYARSLQADVGVKRAVYALLPLAALALRAAVGALLRERRYDVLHAHWVVPNAALVADLARAHRVPLVVSLHGSDVFLAERSRLVRALARHAFAAAGAVTACSRDLHERAVALGAPSARTRTVPYGVDLEAFTPTTPDVAAVRARLGAAPGAFLVVAVGRLVEKKGFTHLVAAAAGTPGLQVVIAGEGDLRGELEEQARRLGAPVRLLGNLDRAGVADALAAADAVAVPSVVDRAGNVDGLPNTLLEALGAGRPVVASAVAGIPDVVDHERNGLLVPPGDPGSLRAALQRLLADPALAARLGAEARRRAESTLTWAATARAFERSYAEAAALDAR